MKRMPTALAAALIGSIATMLPAAPAAKLKGSQYAAQSKLSLAAARMAALKLRPGTIADQELEKEKGGSGLRYSFDIMSKGRAYEVGIDAVTGKPLENVPEGHNPD